MDNYHKMIVDVLTQICEFSYFKDKIKLCQITKSTYSSIYIYSIDRDDMYDSVYIKITQSILMQKKFSKIKKLNCYDNSKVNNVNHLKKTLEKLNCGGNCMIDIEGISQLEKLTVLKCSDNNKICSIVNISNFADTIEELDCSFNDSINQNDINKMIKLKVLKCNGNTKIYNVNHLNGTLEKLSCALNSSINQKGISRLTNLKKLNCLDNKHIYDVNHMIYLSKLNCGSDCGINQLGISQLKYLQILLCSSNPTIYDVNHLKYTLKHLECQYTSSIGPSGISELLNLEYLQNFCNPYFGCKPFIF